MNKTGISIPWNYLTGNLITKDALALASAFGKPEKLLSFLRDQNIQSIELRHRSITLSAEEMTAALNLLSDFNFYISIHGDNPPENPDWEIHDVFPWLESLKNTYSPFSEKITVTYHPYNGPGEKSENKLKTISFLKTIADMINNENLPLLIALENQRSKGFIDPGTTFESIVQMKEAINKPEVGICWDMGHCYANYLKDSNNYSEYPEEHFVSSAIHTHIHDIGPDGKTHWPFNGYTVPVPEYMNMLKDAGYTGIYNLELSFERFYETLDLEDSLSRTIEALSAMIHKTDRISVPSCRTNS